MTVTNIIVHDVNILLGPGSCYNKVVFPAVTAEQSSQEESLNSNT